jgi:hypothetical protein
MGGQSRKSQEDIGLLWVKSCLERNVRFWRKVVVGREADVSQVPISRECNLHEQSDVGGFPVIPHVAGPIIGRPFARPGGSCETTHPTGR